MTLVLAHHEVLLAAEAAMLSGLSVATLRSVLGCGFHRRRGRGARDARGPHDTDDAREDR